MKEQQPTNPENNPTTSSQAPEPAIETNMNNRNTPTVKNVVVRNYAIATLIVLLMGGGLWLVLESQGRVQTNFLGTFVNRGPAASVNGVDIARGAYESNRRQVEESALAQGIDINDPMVRSEISTQAIETLINTELLRQEAQRLRITVSAEDIQNRYNEIIEQVGGEEALALRMTELGLDEDTLRSDIENELVIQALFAQQTDVSNIEVTDEEVAEVFSQVSATEEVTVSLDEVREIIETNIRLSKEQEIITQYIQSLRAEADVVIKI
jgi:hypothetical protein